MPICFPLPVHVIRNGSQLRDVLAVAVAIESASYANAGLFISDVSYILFSSMQSSNENDSDNMDNHLMTVPADHIAAVYTPVTADEVVCEVR